MNISLSFPTPHPKGRDAASGPPDVRRNAYPARGEIQRVAGVLIAGLVAVVAAAAALVRGGSLEALAETRLRRPLLLAVGAALQAVAALWAPPWLDDGRALLVVVLANLALVVFVAVNRRLPGMWLADVGLALNLLVIVANGAMPVSTDAARAAGIERSPEEAGLEHEALDDETRLAWLADVVPIPVVREVWSIGDAILAVGVARLVYARTRARRSGRTAEIPAHSINKTGEMF